MSDLLYMERFIFWWVVGSRISVLRSAGRKIVFSGNIDMAHHTASPISNTPSKILLKREKMKLFILYSQYILRSTGSCLLLPILCLLSLRLLIIANTKIFYNPIKNTSFTIHSI